MQQIFIELYNYRPAWAKCSESDRTDFVTKVVEAVKGLKSAGVDVVGYGTNSTQTDHRAPYDFFCVYRVPNVKVQRAFEQQVAASGSWTNCFAVARPMPLWPPVTSATFPSSLPIDSSPMSGSSVSSHQRFDGEH